MWHTHIRTQRVCAVEVCWAVRRLNMKSHSNVTAGCQRRGPPSDRETLTENRERKRRGGVSLHAAVCVCALCVCTADSWWVSLKRQLALFILVMISGWQATVSTELRWRLANGTSEKSNLAKVKYRRWVVEVTQQANYYSNRDSSLLINTLQFQEL